MRTIRMLVMSGVSAVVLVLLFTLPVFANSSTSLKIMIFPLECSVDLMNVGVGIYRQLTPENCMDPIEEPIVPAPTDSAEGAQSDDRPQGTAPTSIFHYPYFISSSEHMPIITNVADGSEIASPIIPLVRHDDSNSIKSLPHASSMTWLAVVVIGLPVLLIAYRLLGYVLALIRRR